MTRRVLLSLENASLATGVVAHLHQAGYGSVIVTNPEELVHQSVDVDAVAVVAQDRYLGDKRIDGILERLLAARGQPLPTVLVCGSPVDEDRRRELLNIFSVRAYLNSNTSAAAVLDAVRVATGAMPAPNQTETPFDDMPSTLNEEGEDPDMPEDLQELAERLASGAQLKSTEDGAPDEKTAVVDRDASAKGSTLDPDATCEVDVEALREIDRQAQALERGGADQATAGDAAEGADPVDALRSQLESERRARERAEGERDRSQRVAKEHSEGERRLRERVQKLENTLEEVEMTKANENEAENSRLKRLENEIRELRKSKVVAERRAKALEDELRGVQEGEPLGDRSFDEDEAAPPDEGRFEQIPYPRLLGRLLRHKFTGSLALRSGSVNREIYFVEGKPVAFSSAEPGERIGRILVDQERISEEQYLTAARRMVERGVRLTEALLELGYIDSEQLVEEQRFLTRDQIVSGFGMVEGSFSLSAGTTPPNDAARFDFAPGEIYVAGYRQYAPDGEVKALFETMRRLYIRATDELNGYRPKLGLEAEDERLLRFLGQAYTVEEAVGLSGVSEERAARLLGALRGLGLMRAWNPGVPQFEERLRAMEREHQQAVSALREEAQRRIDRMLGAFERALEKVGAGGAKAALGDLRAARESERQAEPVSEPPPPESRRNGERSVSAPQESRDEDSRPASKTSAGGTAGDRSPDSRENLAFVPPANKAGIGIEPVPEDEPEALDEPLEADEPDIEPPQDLVKSFDLGKQPPANSPGKEKFREGMKCAAQGQLDEAEVALREAVRMDPHQPTYLAALGRVLLSNPKYDRAGTLPVVRSLLERAQKIAPDDSEIRALLARVSSEQAQAEA